MFGNIFDATVEFGDHESMDLLLPSELDIGDIVTVECIATRLRTTGGYRMSYHALTIALLLSAPESTRPSPPENVLSVPPCRFTRRL